MSWNQSPFHCRAAGLREPEAAGRARWTSIPSSGDDQICFPQLERLEQPTAFSPEPQTLLMVSAKLQKAQQ